MKKERMSELNKIVHSLWIGATLSPLEQMTIHSFLRQGHEFHLWLYDHVDNVPEGAVVEDANRILHFDRVFQYRDADPEFRFGKGSYAGFSDIFRYRLLFEKGGWWSDMDVTCLKTLQFESPYVFRDHNETLSVVGNIMKCPPNSPLMEDCFQRAVREVNADSKDWAKPVQILCEAVRKYRLQDYIVSGIANRDLWEEIEPLLVSRAPISSKLYVFHWCHENWRYRGIDKFAFEAESTFADLLIRYGVLEEGCREPHRCRHQARSNR